MKESDRKSVSVSFERGLDVAMIAIDGTWQRPATLKEISATGASILVDGSLERLQLNEFFLVFSRQGVVYRRCELVQVNQNEVGIRFLKSEIAPKRRGDRLGDRGRQ